MTFSLFEQKVMNDPRVAVWFDIIEAAPSTRRTYSIFMRQFCECTKMLPFEHIDEAVREIKEGKIGAERTILSHIAAFKKCQTERDVSSNTFGLSMTTISSFYKTFDIILPARAGKQKKRDALYENKSALTFDEVKYIISSVQNVREKALLLLLATSGLARKEVVKLRVRDIVFDEDGIGTIYIRRKKTSVDFITFTTPEFRAAWNVYLKWRNGNEKFKVKGDDDYVFVNYQDGGSVNENTYVKLFELMAKRLGFENKNNNRKGLYNRLHGHAIRSFFSRRLLDAACPMPLIRIFMGHSKNSVDEAYYSYDANNPDDVLKLKEKYKLYIKYFAFDATYELSSLDKKDKKTLEEQGKLLEVKDREIRSIKLDLEGIQNSKEREIEMLKKQMGTLVESQRILENSLKNAFLDNVEPSKARYRQQQADLEDLIHGKITAEKYQELYPDREKINRKLKIKSER